MRIDELTKGQFEGTEVIDGYLDLSHLTSIPEGFNPTVGKSLYLSSLTSIPDGFNPTVGGSLDLRSLTSIPDGFNPSVGGSLDLRSLTSIPDGFNPTVGGVLDLRSLTSIPEGFNKTDYENKHIPVLSWENGKYVLIDGVFAEVLKHVKNVYKLKNFNSSVLYCVTDGQGKYAHGETLKEAKESLIYKISSRNKDKYKGIKQDTVLSFQESIEFYRIITGACEAGVKHFIKNCNVSNKHYSVKEIIEITNGQYGNDELKIFVQRQLESTN